MVHGEIQPFGRNAVNLGEQFVSPDDGFPLEVVAEGEVAQHLEESVVAGAGADVFQVVVLAGNPHTALHSGGAGVGALVEAEENVFELHHPGVGEEQGLVAAGHERRGRHNGVAFGFEEFEEGIANLIAGHFLIGHGETSWWKVWRIIPRGSGRGAYTLIRRKINEGMCCNVSITQRQRAGV